MVFGFGQSFAVGSTHAGQGETGKVEGPPWKFMAIRVLETIAKTAIRRWGGPRNIGTPPLPPLRFGLCGVASCVNWPVG